MEIPSLQVLDQLAILIKKLSSKNQEEFQEATRIMTQSVQESPTKFTDSMMAIVLADLPETEETFKLKRDTCIFTPRFLSVCDDLTLDQRIHIIDSILRVLFSEHVLFTLKKYLETSLLMFYSTDTDGKLRNKGLKLAASRLVTGQLADCYGSLMIINTIISGSTLYQKEISEWFVLLIEGLIRSGETLVNGVLQEIRDSMGEQNQDHRLANIFVGFTVIKVWVEVILLFSEKLVKVKYTSAWNPSYIELLLEQERILEIITKLIKIYLPTATQGDMHLISMSGVTQIDEVLNSMKTKILACFNVILLTMKTYSNAGIQEDPNINRFFGFIQGLGAKFVLDHTFRFCKTKADNFERIFGENNYLQECVVEALKFVTNLAERKELISLLFNYKEQIVMTICIPLIKSTREEIINFTEDPQDFVGLAIDTVQKQSFETPKTQAMQLLETLCKNVDGTLYYTVSVLLEVLRYCLFSNEVKEIPEKFPLLNNFIESSFIKNAESQIKVETCILSLTNLGYLIVLRKDLRESIEAMLVDYHKYFLGDTVPAIIQARLCLFLGFYIRNIFQEDNQKQMFELYIDFLIRCAGVTNQKMWAVADQACHSLNLIFDPKKPQIKRLYPYIGLIMNKLTTYIKEAKTTEFFELIIEIAKAYQDNLLDDEALPIKIVKALTERAEAEYLLCMADHESERHTLTKVWNAILNIVEIKEIILRFQYPLENVLVDLFRYLEDDIKFPFIDDILDYMALVIKTRKEVTPLFWTLSKLFKRIFENQECELMHLFGPINQVIIHGGELIKNDLEALKSILNILVLGLEPKGKRSNSANVSEAAILLQVAMQYLMIPNDIWNEILLACLKRIETVEKAYLKARIGGVFLIAFVRDFQLTQDCLVYAQAAGSLIDLLLENVIQFETHPYDRKVFLIGFSTIMAQDNLDPSIRVKVPQILGILVMFFKYVEIIEKRSLQRAEIYKLLPNANDEAQTSDVDFLREFLRDDLNVLKAMNGTSYSKPPKNLFEDEKQDSDNLDILDLDQIQEENQRHENDEETFDADEHKIVLTAQDIANKIMDIFETDLKERDEFGIFKEAIKHLKTVHPDYLKELYDALPEHKRTILEQILYNQRLVLKQDEEVQTQTRKIVKARARKPPSKDINL